MINVNMFDVHQSIYLIENEKPVKTTSVPLNELVDFVLGNEQWNKNIEEIEIDGNKNFIQKIGYDFKTSIQKQFSNRNVRILINGEVFN